MAEQIDYLLNSDFKNVDQEIKKNQFLFYKEVLRNLYANIKLSLSDKEIKILSITSTLSGEGKSFVTTLLAKVLSHYNYKVLLIDADLRKPILHKIFLVDNLSGLTNVISEKPSDFKKYIKVINIFSTIVLCSIIGGVIKYSLKYIQDNPNLYSPEGKSITI